jgi:ubiquinone biosynthesis protein UbiJ
MLTSTIENILNRGLPRSPRARELCAELTGRRIGIEVRGVASFRVESDGNAVRITRGPAEGAEAWVRGGLMSLIALARADATLRGVGSRAATEGGSDVAPGLGDHDAERAGGSTAERAGVQLDGDVELAERFRELALLLRPDLEEELSLAIGDVPAHQLARFARAAAGWWRGAAETTVRNFAEYFAHERGDLISRAEGRQLLDGIDETRERIDRIESRIDLLAQRLRVERPESRRS